MTCSSSIRAAKLLAFTRCSPAPRNPPGSSSTRSTCAGFGSRMERIANPASMKLPEPVPPAEDASTTTRSSCSISSPNSASCFCRPMLFSTALPCSRTMCWNRANWS